MAFRRFFAALTILSVTFTQVLPAWALRPEGAADPRVKEAIRAGLEETVHPERRSAVETARVLVPGGSEFGIVHATRGLAVERGDCGCFVRVGKPQSQGGLSTNEIVLKAARALEPRGYQSAGAGVITLGDEPAFEVRKVLGAVDQLEQVINGNPLPDGNVQLVHLRWPTQGEPSEDNQHPTPLLEGQNNPSEVEIIFNGDIINFREIDEFLVEHGIQRPENVTSDAWSIGALIWYYFNHPSDEQISNRAEQIYIESSRVAGRDEENWLRAEQRLRTEGVRMPLLEAVSLAAGRLEGDFALIAVSELEPDKAIGVLRGQKPLIVGRGKTPEVGNFIGSEASTFIDYTDLNQPMKSGDIVVITQDNVKFYRRTEARPGHFTLAEIPANQRPVQQLDVEEVRVSKTHDGVEYPTYTEKEIFEQPDALRKTLEFQGRLSVLQARTEGRAEPMPGINLDDEKLRSAKRILIVAMGTASHAGECAKNFLMEDAGLSPDSNFKVDVETGTTLFDTFRGQIYRLVRRVNPAVVMPSDLDGWLRLIKEHRNGALKGLVRHYEDTVGIAVSQSGNTMDTNQLVILLQALGVPFIGIVNKPIETPLIRLAKDDGGLFRTKSGAEVGVASTKAFTAQVAAFRMLSLYIGLVRRTLSPDEVRTKLTELRALPDRVEQWLSNENNREVIRRIAGMLSTQQTLMFLARGPQVPVAKEGALKMLELAYLFATGMDLALMKHGFIANFPESRDPLARRFAVTILTDRASFADALVNMSEIRARYGHVIAICYESDVARVRPYANDIIAIPDVSDDLAPIMAALPLQMLAAETTMAIDEIGKTVAGWSEKLYWEVRQRETGVSGVSDQQLLRTLKEVAQEYGELSNDGRLELLSTAKVRQCRLLLEEAIRAGEQRQSNVMEDKIRQVIRVMRGPRLAMIMFFDHELARFSSPEPSGPDQGNGTILTAQEHASVIRIMESAIFSPQADPTKTLDVLSNALAVFYSQVVSRGSTLKVRWKDWLFDKGLGEFLGRNLDRPRGLAKEVTVDRLTHQVRNQLSGMGVSSAELDSVFLGTQRLAGSRIQEYPGVVRAISAATNVPEATVRRRAMMHEQAHFILRQTGRLGELLLAVKQAIETADLKALVKQGPALYVPFQTRFERVFGEFDSEGDYLEEVLTKYISSRLTGVDREFFEPIRPGLEALLGSTALRWSGVNLSGRLPHTLAELFDASSSAPLGRRGTVSTNPEAAKAIQLADAARALGLDPAIQVEEISEGTVAETERLLVELGRSSRAEAPISVSAGLEEWADTEMDQRVLSEVIRYGLNPVYNAKDTENDWAVLDSIRGVLEKSGPNFLVRYGDAVGVQWAFRQPAGADYRRYFELSVPGQDFLTVAPAYRVMRAGTPERVVLVTLGAASGSRRTWVLPADSNLAGRLSALVAVYARGDLVLVPQQTAASPVVGMPTPEQFEAELDRALESLDLPRTGPFRDEVLAAFRSFCSDGHAKVVVAQHPLDTKNPNRGVLAAIHADRPGMEADVIDPLSKELKANYEESRGHTVGDVALVLLNFQNRGKAALQPMVDKIQRALDGAIMPTSFLGLLQPYLAQMEGAPLPSIYGAYLVLQRDPRAPNYVLTSTNVPDEATQSALSAIVREGEGPVDLDSGIRAVLKRKDIGLEIAQDKGRELALHVVYQENPDHRRVRIARYVVNAQIEDPRIGAAEEAVQALVNGGGAPAVAAEDVARTLKAAQERVLRLLLEHPTASTLVVYTQANIEQQDRETGPITIGLGRDEENRDDAKRYITAALASALKPTHAVAIEAVLDPAAGDRIVVRPAAGLEELVEGTHYEAMGVNGVRFLQAVRVTKPIRLSGEFGTVTLDPTKNGKITGESIVVAPGAWLLDGARVEGPAAVEREARVGGYLEGSIERPLVIGQGAKAYGNAKIRESVLGPNVKVDSASVRNLWAFMLPQGGAVEVGASSVVEDVVLFGKVGTGVKISEHMVVGPHVEILNNSEQAGSFFWGAGDRAGIKFPHHGFTEAFFAYSGIWEGEPGTAEYYENLRQTFHTNVLGSVILSELGEIAPVSESGALRNITYRMDGQERVIQAQRINFGAGFVTSDYNAMTGVRSAGSASGGVSTGVSSVAKFPVVLDKRSLVANLSQASGELTEGTIVIGADPPGKVEGYRSLDKGFILGTDFVKEVGKQSDYYRKLRIAAEVLAEAARQATDRWTLTGKAEAVRAVRVEFEGIEPRFSKALTTGLPISIENISERLEQVKIYLRRLQNNGEPQLSVKITRAQEEVVREVEGEIRRLTGRLKNETELLAGREAVLKEWNDIRLAIRKAAESVEPVTQPLVAEWARQTILQPGTQWVNPLASAGLEEVPIAQVVQGLQQDLNAMGDLQAVSPLSMATIVDLTVDETGRPNPAAALVVPYLPAGTVAIVRSLDDLLVAEQISGRTAQAAVVSLDTVGNNFAAAVRSAMDRVSSEYSNAQFLTGRSQEEIDSVLDSLGEVPVAVHILAPAPLDEMLQTLRVDEAMRTAFMALFQRARDNWDGLVQYL